MKPITLELPVKVTFTVEAFGRVVGTIAHNGAEAAVSGSERESAMEDLRVAVESAAEGGHGECFWREAMVDTRWLFRKEGGTMRVAIIRSTGTLTGWEHCFWAECGLEEFRSAMREGMEAYSAAGV
ncbi:MAG: hypothetical protein KGN36_12530 [Acidobacteriota bacterium]|nr:hypothetical protein [Acidobacteriota bacterium]